MTAWTDLVKKIWNENKGKADFSFKKALQMAKAQYKSNPLKRTVKKLKNKILKRSEEHTSELQSH